jgi:hypothetical protein
MVKKHGKDTFRHTKKNILHKKRVNSKKRGLRGGELNTTPKIDSDGLHGITKLVTFSREKDLTNDVCSEWFNKIHGLNTDTILKAFKPDGTLKTTITGRKDYDICSSRLNDKTIEKYKKIIEQAKKQGGKVETGVNLDFHDKYKDILNDEGQFVRTDVLPPSNLPEIQEKILNQDREEERKEELFDTTLTTLSTKAKKNDKNLKPETLTLRGCVAVRRPFRVDSIPTSHFEYNIYSPAATTQPPIGREQQQTPVGTFTQLPVSFLLKLVGQETPFSFASFYRSNDVRASYFTDYIECLKNVKTKFGPDVTPTGEQHQESTFVGSSKLREFGKSEECKIVLVAGNIGTKIQDPANNGAMFSLASQLSATEYLNPESGPTTTLDDYKEDPTGGPIAQLSCSPPVAQFILLHGARTGFNSNFLVINAIDDIISELRTLGITSLTLNNGYLEVPSKLQSGEELDLTNSQNPPEKAITIFDSLSTRLKVLQTGGVRADGLTPPGIYSKFNCESKTKVTLIYSSAVPLNYNSRINPEKSMLQYCVAGFDLVAQYFGAMVSAYHKSKKPGVALGKKVKLFLTPLGGGVFKNPREMIASSVLLAYYQAQQLLPNFDDKVEIIFLAWDGNLFECSDFMKFFNEDGSITKLVKDKETADNKQRADFLKEQNEELAALGQEQSPPPTPDVVEAEQLEQPPPADVVEAVQLEQPPHDADASGIHGSVDKLLPEEGQPDTMTGDELFEKMMKGEDPSPEEKDTYQKIVLQKFKKGNYQVKRIEKWDYKSVSEELKKSEGFRSEVLDLLSITPNGDVYGKLSYLVNIFYSLNCKDNDCLKIYLITAALLPFFHTQGGGSKSRRRHRRKPVRKTHRGRTRKYKSKSKSKSKPKTHRRRRHSRVRKNKKYTSRRR